MVTRVLSDPRLAARYDFTAEQLEQLKLVNFQASDLSEADHQKITDLFLTAATARTQWRTKMAQREKNPSLPDPEKEKLHFTETELALKIAVGNLVITPGELNAYDAAVEAARALMRPDQLDLIDSGFDRPNASPARTTRGSPSR